MGSAVLISVVRRDSTCAAREGVVEEGGDVYVINFYVQK